MNRFLAFVSWWLGLVVIVVPQAASAAPRVDWEPQRLTVTAPAYRAVFHRSWCDVQIELRDGRGHWRPILKPKTSAEFALVDAQGVHSSHWAPARLQQRSVGDAVVVGLCTVLSTSRPALARAHFLCTDDGMLVRFECASENPQTNCWALPRLTLDEKFFDTYTYWRPDDRPQSGAIADLGSLPAYVGVSSWGKHGDTAARLSAKHPAVMTGTRPAGISLAAIFHDPPVAAPSR